MKNKPRQRVTVYKREYKGSTKLWLNYRINGQRFREPLNLYLDPAKTTEAKIKNSNTLRLAEQIAAEKSEQLTAAELGIEVKHNKLTTFADYSRKDLENHANQTESYQKCKNKVIRFVLEWMPSIRMVDFNRKTFKSFVEFLTSKGQSPNTIITNASILKGIIHRAHLDDVITQMPDFSGLLPKQIQKPRQYLTMDELRILLNTPTNEKWSQPFFFSCFTGLRYSDIKKLKWSDIQDDVILMMQTKTKQSVQIPLSENAKRFLPQKKGHALVFHDLCCNDRLTYRIHQWCQKAGITKNISFHCARHTFATNALDNGANVAVISKLLGHTKLQTTMVYLKATDEGRKKAVDSIPTL